MTPLGWSALARALAAIVAMSVSPQGGASDESARLAALEALLRQGRYEEAETTAAMLAPRAWAADADKVRAHQLYVEALLRNGRAAEAKTLTLARQLVADGSSPPSGPTAASSFRLVGLTMLEGGHYGEARRHLATARELDAHAFGSHSAQVAADLEGLARSLLWLEEPGAVDAIDAAVAIREDGAANDLAAALAIRSELHQRGGRYALARADIDRAIQLWERGTLEVATTVDVFTVAADQAWLDSKFEEAAAQARRAVGAAETAFRRGHPKLAAPLRCLANSLVEIGAFGEAQVARQRGLDIAEAALGSDHPLVAGQWHDLALSLTQQGIYGDARLALRRALAIYQHRLGPEHSFLTSAVLNLANVSLAIGDFREAAALYRKAETNWEHRFGAAHPNISWALIGRAEAAVGVGRHAEAVRLLDRALSIRRKTMSGEHARVARTLTALARSLASLGQMNRATAASDEAIETWIASKQAEGLSEALLVRATIDTARGDDLRARASLERALQIRLELFGNRHHSVGETLARLSGTLAALGNADEAATVALRAETIERDHLQLTLSSLPERQALTFATSRPKALDVALSALPAGGSPNDTFDAVVRSRAVILDEMSARRQFLATSADSALRPLLDARTAAAQRLANLVVRGLGSASPRIYAAALADAERERVSTETALAEQSARFRNQRERRDVGFRDVSASLPAASAMISFVRYARTPAPQPPAQASGVAGVLGTRPSYLALVLRAGEAHPTVVDLGDAASLDHLVGRWRRDVVGRFTATGNPAPGAESALKARGAAIRRRLWDPLQASLVRLEQVFIVPDGSLNLLPFAALPASDGRYLVETGPTIHYLSAERDLVDSAGERTLSAEGLLALGGPAYGPTRAPDVAIATSTASGRRDATCGTFDSMEFHPLPAARREVEDVATLWRTTNGSADVLTGARATEAAFKRSAPGRSYLHLATHGFFLGNDCDDTVYTGRGLDGVRGIGGRKGGKRQRILPENPLLLSGLALAGANQRRPSRANPEDGILTAEEVAALDLDGVEWAVLSACDTGVGEIKAGEGVFGLRRAFRVAGARTIIMSLWAVEDRAARAWMRPLYEGRLRDRLSTAEAVRSASRTVLAERRAKGLSTHPFYWAGFVAAGDWR